MDNKKNVIILGGGIGGLSAGWALARTGHYRVTIIESASEIGGACGTFRYDDFLLDYGPHKSYSVIPGVMDELRQLMGDEFIKLEKRNTIYLFGHYLKYPISMIDLAFKMGPKNLIASGFSMLGTIFNVKKTDSINSYEEYAVKKFGRKIYQLVFEPLADKVWGNPTTLSADIARTRIPSVNIIDTALRSVGLKKESTLTDAKYFYYPKKGFGRIPEVMAKEIEKYGGIVHTNAKPVRILHNEMKIDGLEIEHQGKNQTISTDILISSIPFDKLVVLLGGEKDIHLKDALVSSRKLQYRNAILVYVFLNKDFVTDQHWIFFPERDIVFSRVFEQKRLSHEMTPQNRTVLCCDFTDYEDGKLWKQSDEQLAEICIKDLEKVGLIKKEWVKKTHIKRLPKFYPRYDLLYKETIATLYNSLKKFDNLLCTGRVGFYNYNNSDHCVDMGRFIAEKLEACEDPRQIWSELEQRVGNYRIVD